VESAKMLATFLHMMQGTPYIYQGEELGMTNVRFESIEEYNDIEIHNMYREKVIEGNEDHDKVMEAIYVKGRDNARTPIQWDGSENAGFTTGTPWLKVNPNFKEINAKNALEDKDSTFYYYQQLIRLRKEHDIIVYGTYDLILEEDEKIYAYTRTLGDEKLLVMCNFSAEDTNFNLPEHIRFESTQLLITNYDVQTNADISSVTLKPYESRVYLLK
jgi:oligo-1,6-glucosidase